MLAHTGDDGNVLGGIGGVQKTQTTPCIRYIPWRLRHLQCYSAQQQHEKWLHAACSTVLVGMGGVQQRVLTQPLNQEVQVSDVMHEEQCLVGERSQVDGTGWTACECKSQLLQTECTQDLAWLKLSAYSKDVGSSGKQPRVSSILFTLKCLN